MAVLYRKTHAVIKAAIRIAATLARMGLAFDPNVSARYIMSESFAGWIMTRALILSLSVLILTSFCNQASLGAPIGVPQEPQLVALTDEWTNAINAKDRSKLEVLMAPNFTLHAWDNSWSVDRSSWMKNLMERYHLDEYHHSAIVARIYGDTADVTSKWYWRGIRDNKSFEEHGYVLDVWRQNSGTWQVLDRITVIQPGKE